MEGEQKMLSSQTLRIKHYKLEQLKCDEWLALQIINSTLQQQNTDFLETVKTGVVPCQIYNSLNEDYIDIQQGSQMYYYLENHSMFYRKVEQFKYDGQDLFKEPPLQSAVSTLARALVVLTHKANPNMIDIIMHQAQKEPSADEEDDFIEIAADQAQQVYLGDFLDYAPNSKQPYAATEEEQERLPSGQHEDELYGRSEDAHENEPMIEQAIEEVVKTEQETTLEQPTGEVAAVQMQVANEEDAVEKQVAGEAEAPAPLTADNISSKPSEISAVQPLQNPPSIDISTSNPPDFQPLNLYNTDTAAGSSLKLSHSTLSYPLPQPQEGLMKITAKIALVGASASGKTSLLRCLKNYPFDTKTSATASMDLVRLAFSANNNNYALTVYDTAGQEQYSSVVSTHVQKAEIVLLCFDVSSRDSFASLDGWFRKCQKDGQSVILCGLQGDKPSSVAEAEIERFCSDRKIRKHVICSSKTAAGVSFIFYDIWLRGEQEDIQTVQTAQKDAKDGKRGCCE